MQNADERAETWLFLQERDQIIALTNVDDADSVKKMLLTGQGPRAADERTRLESAVVVVQMSKDLLHEFVRQQRVLG
jgi:hypothetical protein